MNKRRKRAFAERRRRAARRAPRATQEVYRELRLVPIESDWHIKSNRTTKEHTRAFAYLLKAEVDATPDALVLDGVHNAIRHGLSGSMSESQHSIPAGEIGDEAGEVARVMYVTIVRDFHGEDIVLGEIGFGLKQGAGEAELALLRRRYRMES